MEILLIKEILILFGLSICVLMLFHRIHVPPIVGFFVTGILVGPHGLGMISAIHEVEILAEIGVVLLLFTIGIEFSLKKLLKIKKSVLIGGSLQVLLTLLTAAFIVSQIGIPVNKSIFIGFLVSLSSTAIVLKIIQERAEVDSPHGNTILGILIFQDIIIVPMILVTPILAGVDGAMGETLLFLLIKAIGIILLVIAGAKWIVPWLLYQIARTRNRELFLLSIVVICLAVAWITSSAGLSLALGAFLAGLIISESEYGHEALGNILPFRDVFTTFFFVSIGMLLDVGFLFRQPGYIALAALCVLFLKSIIAGSVTILMGFPLRTGILAGFSLGQIGEFSFILSGAGVENGLFDGDIYQTFLSVSVLTMAATPFIIGSSPRLADIILQIPLPKRLVSGLYSAVDMGIESKKDHLIIIGFGVNGRNLAMAAKAGGIPYVIIEMNPETVKREKARGEPIFYGDATHEAILQHALLKAARIVVVAINDPTATRRITEILRRLNPDIHLIIRTRYLREVKPLYELGADEVIPEEFETSVEIFTRVLIKYLVPKEDIDRFVAEVRSDGYEMFRSRSSDQASLSDFKLQLPGVEINTLRICEGSVLVGKSLSEVGLRKKYGVTVLAIQRNSEIFPNPDGEVVFFSGDNLFILGSPDKIAKVSGLFRNQKEE